MEQGAASPAASPASAPDTSARRQRFITYLAENLPAGDPPSFEEMLYDETWSMTYVRWLTMLRTRGEATALLYLITRQEGPMQTVPQCTEIIRTFITQAAAADQIPWQSHLGWSKVRTALSRQDSAQVVAQVEEALQIYDRRAERILKPAYRWVFLDLWDDYRAAAAMRIQPA